MPEQKKPLAGLLTLPHHKARNRPHMSMHDRATQFSSFTALTGFDDVIAGISIAMRAEVHFVPDALREDGSYREFIETVR